MRTLVGPISVGKFLSSGRVMVMARPFGKTPSIWAKWRNRCPVGWVLVFSGTTLFWLGKQKLRSLVYNREMCWGGWVRMQIKVSLSNMISDLWIQDWKIVCDNKQFGRLQDDLPFPTPSEYVKLGDWYKKKYSMN